MFQYVSSQKRSSQRSRRFQKTNIYNTRRRKRVSYKIKLLISPDPMIVQELRRSLSFTPPFFLPWPWSVPRSTLCGSACATSLPVPRRCPTTLLQPPQPGRRHLSQMLLINKTWSTLKQELSSVEPLIVRNALFFACDLVDGRRFNLFIVLQLPTYFILYSQAVCLNSASDNMIDFEHRLGRMRTKWRESSQWSCRNYE